MNTYAMSHFKHKITSQSLSNFTEPGFLIQGAGGRHPLNHFCPLKPCCSLKFSKTKGTTIETTVYCLNKQCAIVFCPPPPVKIFSNRKLGAIPPWREALYKSLRMIVTSFFAQNVIEYIPIVTESQTGIIWRIF